MDECLKVGDTIKCHDAEDLRRELKELGRVGYRASTFDREKFIIKITGLPKGE